MMHVLFFLLKWYILLALLPAGVAALMPGMVGKIGRMLLRWHEDAGIALGCMIGMPFVGVVIAAQATPTLRDNPKGPSRDGPSCLPAWAWFANTPDDPTGEQGDYEPQVLAFQQRIASFLFKRMPWVLKKWPLLPWRAKTWYWISVRNVCYALFWALADKTTATTKFTTRNAPYPRVKPYQGGMWWGSCEIDGRLYVEVTVVWPYGSKAGEYRWGWKVQTLMPLADGTPQPGPLAWLWQPKVFPMSTS